MNIRLALIWLAIAYPLAACSLPGARTQVINHYVLEVPPPALIASVPAAAMRPVLLLRESEPGGFAQSLRLVYSRAPGTQAHYQYARWNEAPPKRLHTLLRQRLLASGVYAAVTPLGSGVQGDYQLNFRVLDFFHNAETSPGTAVVRLEAELIERSTARLIGQQMFVAQAPVARPDAAAAAAGLGQASGQALDAVVAWAARIQPISVANAQAR
jgi:cholesterol transport system auxiliary component